MLAHDDRGAGPGRDQDRHQTGLVPMGVHDVGSSDQCAQPPQVAQRAHRPGLPARPPSVRTHDPEPVYGHRVGDEADLVPQLSQTLCQVHGVGPHAPRATPDEHHDPHEPLPLRRLRPRSRRACIALRSATIITPR